MVERTPIHSVLSFGLRLRDAPLGVLTLYSARAQGFPVDAVDRATLLTEHVAVAIDAELASHRVATLELALASNRTIGMALGILIERQRVTPERAFEMLRRASNDENRKLVDVAEELVETGRLPVRTAFRPEVGQVTSPRR